ncbi:MAG: type II toxin-antitoxin system VapC family toxin [Gammaproteobacteria bacterium]|nr:type II toxin-antitoxin system VapC family toxin [Gammaproteobacteria bacterium]MCY4343333.1 type II toxin-antitoxin system VapC family toxin [Gammaproteobacteria bacterium]
MTVALDASALLAYLQRESGADSVRRVLRGSIMSTVNWAEVVQRVPNQDMGRLGLRADLESLGLSFEPFSAVQAEIAGQLREATKALGLSLGDRACLALGMDRDALVYTADRAWTKLSLGVEVESIR